jgi:hypothetical protein
LRVDERVERAAPDHGFTPALEIAVLPVVKGCWLGSAKLGERRWRGRRRVDSCVSWGSVGAGIAEGASVAEVQRRREAFLAGGAAHAPDHDDHHHREVTMPDHLLRS